MYFLNPGKGSEWLLKKQPKSLQRVAFLSLHQLITWLHYFSTFIYSKKGYGMKCAI